MLNENPSVSVRVEGHTDSRCSDAYNQQLSQKRAESVVAYLVGAGIDASRLQFDYGRRIVAKPILGCGVVINGRRAIFEPWLLKSR